MCMSLSSGICFSTMKSRSGQNVESIDLASGELICRINFRHRYEMTQNKLSNVTELFITLEDISRTTIVHIRPIFLVLLFKIEQIPIAYVTTYFPTFRILRNVQKILPKIKRILIETRSSCLR